MSSFIHIWKPLLLLPVTLNWIRGSIDSKVWGHKPQDPAFDLGDRLAFCAQVTGAPHSYVLPRELVGSSLPDVPTESHMYDNPVRTDILMVIMLVLTRLASRMPGTHEAGNSKSKKLPLSRGRHQVSPTNQQLRQSCATEKKWKPRSEGGSVHWMKHLKNISGKMAKDLTDKGYFRTQVWGWWSIASYG